MYIGTATGVVRAEAIKRKTELRTVCLGCAERSRGCTVETDSRRAPVMQYHQQGIPLQKAAATTSAASREEDGSTADCHGCDAILTRGTAKNHGTQRRERLMTEKQHDERLVRRVQAVENCKRRRPNAEGKRDAVRPAPCSRMMLRTISPVQSQAVTGTEISQVPVIRSWKSTQYKHLRKEATYLLRQNCNESQTQELGVPMIGCHTESWT